MRQRKDAIALPPLHGLDRNRCTPLMEARHLQRLMFAQACKPKVTASALSALARAWVLVQDSIRVMRGIPSPGQLRPDLDPVQMKRALKRLRARAPIDVSETTLADPTEEPEETPKTATDVSTRTEEPSDQTKPKESLSTEQTVTARPPPGEDVDG